MSKLIFVVEKLKELENGVLRVLGEYEGELPNVGDSVEVLSYGGRKSVAIVRGSGEAYKINEDDAELPYVDIEGIEREGIFKYDIIKYQTIDVSGGIDEMSKKLSGETVSEEDRLSNTRLVTLIKLYKKNNSEEVLGSAFEALAIGSKFYVVIIGDGGKGGKIPTLQTKNGKRYYAIFTSSAELAKSPKIPNSGVVVMNFDDIVASLTRDKTANGVAIDPFSTNMIMDRKTIAYVKERKESLGLNGKNDASNGQQAIIKTPEDCPEEFVGAIIEKAKTIATLKRLWLREVTTGEEVIYLLIADFIGAPDKVYKPLFAEIRTASEKTPLAKEIKIAPYGDKFTKSACEGIKPIYSK